MNATATPENISRRSLVCNGLAAGLVACTMGMARTAFADDARPADAVLPELSGRTTLHGMEGGMYDPDRDLTDEEVQLLLQAALTAPSAVGAKSLELVVIRDRETMQKIHELSPNANELESCPVCIALVEHDTEDAHSRFFQYDSGLAAMALLVQASAMGISSCVCEARAQDKDTQADNDYSFFCGSMETYHPQLFIALGYPAVDSQTSASTDNYAESRVHFEAIEA